MLRARRSYIDLDMETWSHRRLRRCQITTNTRRRRRVFFWTRTRHNRAQRESSTRTCISKDDQKMSDTDLDGAHRPANLLPWVTIHRKFGANQNLESINWTRSKWLMLRVYTRKLPYVSFFPRRSPNRVDIPSFRRHHEPQWAARPAIFVD